MKIKIEMVIETNINTNFDYKKANIILDALTLIKQDMESDWKRGSAGHARICFQDVYYDISHKLTPLYER